MRVDAEGITHRGVVGEDRLIRSEGQDVASLAVRGRTAERNLTDAGKSGVGRSRIETAAERDMTR